MTGLLALLVFAIVGPDLVLRHAAPRWLARLAFRRMTVTRRFVLPRGPRVVAERPGYRDGALVRGGSPLPPIATPLQIAGATLERDGESTFALVHPGSRRPRRVSFVTRIRAERDGEEIVLRARQGPPFVFAPFVGASVVAWMLEHSRTPGGVLVLAAMAGAFALGHWLLETSDRDAITAAAMETIELHARAAVPDDEADPDRS